LAPRLTKADLEAKVSELEERLQRHAEEAEKREQAKSAPPPEPQTQTSPPQPQYTGPADLPKSRKEILEEYEKEYLARIEREEKERAEIQRAAEELAAKSTAQSQPSSTQGSMPKGWKP